MAVTAPTISPAYARAIAREAYIYGFPIVVNYSTMYKQAIDSSDKDYRAPFNTVGRSPGADLESNWLPAPSGPFYAVLRIYMPGQAVVDGTWKQPRLQPAS